MQEFDVKLTTDNYKENITRICRELRPNWLSDDSDLIIKPLNGGITNSLYACHLKDKHWNDNDTILFRIYGMNTEDFISRSDEMATMVLMKKIELGPQTYGHFQNGICYELISGDILTIDDVYNEKIYTKLAEAISTLQHSKFKGFKYLTEDQTNEIFLFEKLDKLFDLVHDDYKANMNDMTDELLKIIPSKDTIKKEIEFVKSYLANMAVKNNSLIVFSHNDLLLANIINNKSTKSIKFIDYEYGAMNFQAYDIANHFNEFAGVDNPDYSYFPNKEFQLKWLKVYLNAFYKKANDYYKNEPEKQVTVDENMIENFYNEVNKFNSSSHLLWSIWSLIQAQNSSIDFNFVNYARVRFEQYFKHKEKLI